MDPVDYALQRLRQLGDAPLKPCHLVSNNFNPISPHKVGIAHLVLKPRFLLADPTGCGKTPQALVAFAFLKIRDPKLRLMVMADRSAIFQWRSAVKKFLVGIDPEIVGYDLDTGSLTGRHHRYNVYETSNSDVLLLSYHQMARDIDVILRQIENYVVTFDEVQHLKSGEEGKSLYPAALKLSVKARYVWGLTATPIMNRLEELHSIMEIIRPGTFGSVEYFNRRYLLKEWIKLPSSNGRERAFPKIVGEQNLPELMRIIRPFYLQRRPEEIDAHLPEVVTKDVLLEMSPAQRTVYDQIVSRYFPSTTERPGRRLSKLASLTYAQLASDHPATLGVDAPSSKMEELRRILTEEMFGEKIIIYSKFRRVIDLISLELNLLGINSARITGAEKTKAREDAKLTFNGSTDVNVICINKAGGTSIDLQQAKIIIFFDLPWSWGEWQQVLGRARRIGSPHTKILAILLMNRGTICQHAFTILRRKERLVGDTFGLDQETLAVSRDPITSLYSLVRSGRVERLA